jgi:threonine-phosphate decarboxylase
LAKLERFGHGGDLVTAAEMFGNQAGFIDFSSNIYPFGPPSIVIETIQEALREPGFPAIAVYPDPELRSLKKKLARLHCVREEMLLPGNGAAELIDLLVAALKPNRVGVLEPAFSEYRLSAHKRKIPVKSVVTSWEQGFIPGADEMEQLIREVDLLFLGRPNNPSGHFITEAQLEEWAILGERFGTILAVDEAFIDFVDRGETRSFISRLTRFPHVAVLRSLTKLFALPGLRLGYVVAEESLIRRLKQMQVCWSVGGLADRVGCAVADYTFYHAYVDQVRRWLAVERKYVSEALRRFTSMEVYPGEANYLLIRTDNTCTSDELQQQLGKRGLLIRDCSMYPGLDERYVRIAMKRREENKALIQALEEILQSG